MPSLCHELLLPRAPELPMILDLPQALMPRFISDAMRCPSILLRPPYFLKILIYSFNTYLCCIVYLPRTVLSEKFLSLTTKNVSAKMPRYYYVYFIGMNVEGKGAQVSLN